MRRLRVRCGLQFAGGRGFAALGRYIGAPSGLGSRAPVEPRRGEGALLRVRVGVVGGPEAGRLGINRGAKSFQEAGGLPVVPRQAVHVVLAIEVIPGSASGAGERRLGDHGLPVVHDGIAMFRPSLPGRREARLPGGSRAGMIPTAFRFWDRGEAGPRAGGDLHRSLRAPPCRTGGEFGGRMMSGRSR